MRPAFIAATGDVLDLYSRPNDPLHPVVCLDEKPVVLHTSTPPTQRAAPRRVERRNYKYVRQGSGNLFVLVEPLAGWRHVAVTTRRTRQDYAAHMRFLADTIYPHMIRIRWVDDNVSTHGPPALYATFPAAEAHRLRQRVEFYATPTHGSWLNMAVVEISSAAKGSRAQPVPNLPTLCCRTAALGFERGASHRTITWQFSTTNARTKLHDLYPAIQTNRD
jgi:hypothetical protein